MVSISSEFHPIRRHTKHILIRMRRTWSERQIQKLPEMITVTLASEKTLMTNGRHIPLTKMEL